MSGQEPPPAEELDDDELDCDLEFDEGAEFHNNCRCSECCHLLIEADLDDTAREPQFKERRAPIYTDARVTRSGQRKLEGYLLNTAANGYACAFLDRTNNLCSVYETRPWVCRVFDCEVEGREQLIQLGRLPGKRTR